MENYDSKEIDAENKWYNSKFWDGTGKYVVRTLIWTTCAVSLMTYFTIIDNNKNSRDMELLRMEKKNLLLEKVLLEKREKMVLTKCQIESIVGE